MNCVIYYLRSLAICLFAINLAISALADVRSNIHWPRHDDRVMKIHYQYENVPIDTTVWNFSKAEETGERHEMHWINWGDSLLVKLEQGTQSIYQRHGDTVLWKGYENPLLCVRDSIAPIGVLTAFSNGISVSSTMYFKGSYSDNHAVDMVGEHRVELGNSGKLILPKDTIDNVLCVTSITDCLVRLSKHLKDKSIQVGDSLLRQVEKAYRWYSPLYRYPLAENISRSYYDGGVLLQKTEVTLICSPDEQEYALGVINNPEMMLRNVVNHGANTIHQGALGSNNSLADRVSITQDGDMIAVMVNGKVNSNENDNGEVSVLLCDVQGHVWSNQSGTMDSGCYSLVVNTASLSPGYYLLSIINGNERHVERIRIKQ